MKNLDEFIEVYDHSVFRREVDLAKAIKGSLDEMEERLKPLIHKDMLSPGQLHAMIELKKASMPNPGLKKLKNE